MPKTRPDIDVPVALAVAQAAVDNAIHVRESHRYRRTERNSPQRVQDIGIALDRIRDAMSPLRTCIGQYQYGKQTETAEAHREEVRQASAALQRERRKLWKMKPTKEDA